MRRRTAVVVSLVVLAVLGVLWLVQSGALRPGLQVDAARVRRGPLEVTLPVTGIFEARAVELAFEIPGRLADVRVREGDAVEQGQVLAALDGAELEAVADQAVAAAEAARSDATRARAAVEAARQQAQQAGAAVQVALANLQQLQAGARGEELRQAAAAVAAAASARDQARRTLAIQEQLFRQGAVARSQVDAARAQLEAAEAQYAQAVAQHDAVRAGARPEAVEAASQQVVQAEAAARAAAANVRQTEAIASASAATVRQADAAARAARARAGRARISAPFAGLVSRVYLTPGSPVAPNIPVAALIASGGWITADVEEDHIDVVRLNQPASVTADAYPDQVFSGRVTRIGGRVEFRGGIRTVRVRIDLDAPEALRAGTSVDVGLVLSRLPGALLLPIEAIQPGENGLYFVLVIDQGILRRRQVELGERNEFYADALTGLREGEIVAIGDLAALREGQRVRVRLLE